jgi:hypothetical protein
VALLVAHAEELMHQMNMMTGGMDGFGLGGVPGATTFSFQAPGMPFPGVSMCMASSMLTSGLNFCQRAAKDSQHSADDSSSWSSPATLAVQL